MASPKADKAPEQKPTTEAVVTAQTTATPDKSQEKFRQELPNGLTIFNYV